MRTGLDGRKLLCKRRRSVQRFVNWSSLLVVRPLLRFDREERSELPVLATEAIARGSFGRIHSGSNPFARGLVAWETIAKGEGQHHLA